MQRECYCICNQYTYQYIGSLCYHKLSQHHYNFIVWREIASYNNLDSLSGITTTWSLRVLKYAVDKPLSNCIFCSIQLSCQIHISLFAGGVCIWCSLCRHFCEDILKWLVARGLVREYCRPYSESIYPSWAPLRCEWVAATRPLIQRPNITYCRNSHDGHQVSLSAADCFPFQ